jgi:hypothetical protein
METAVARPDPVERDPARAIENATRRYFESVRRNARIARRSRDPQPRVRGGTSRRDTLVRGSRIERWIRRLQERGSAIPDWSRGYRARAPRDERQRRHDHLVHRMPRETEALVQATTRIWCATVGIGR